MFKEEERRILIYKDYKQYSQQHFQSDLQSWTKYLKQMKEIKQAWTGTEKSVNRFCVIFECF